MCEHQKPLIIPVLESETRFPRVTALLESEGIRSLCALPLRTAHRWLGCFGVGSQQPDAYSQEEIEFLSLVADEVALAIDDAYHFEALQQEKDRLQMLLDVSNAVTSNLDLPDLLRAISANLRSIMQSEGAGVALMDQHGQSAAPLRHRLPRKRRPDCGGRNTAGGFSRGPGGAFG